MELITPDDPEATSEDIVRENLEQLQVLFPEAFIEGKVDFEVLRQLLGGAVDEREEKYGLTWHGKRRARQLALTPSTGTLRPRPEDSVDWDITRNLMIEGDNLEVLKLLQKSYSGKVKLIYIDPPYNTGKDFIYPDDFENTIANYLDITGQTENGQKVSTNTEASGRFHTDWLNMMYPRLKLARNLLKDDGLIFVSIDDNEIANLISICEEIFGDENYCGSFIWEKKKKPSFLSTNMGSVTDYIVAFAKNRQASPAFVAGTVEDGKKYPFNNAGNGVQTLTFPPGSVRFLCDDQIFAPQDMSEGNIKTELLDDVVVEGGRNANAFRLRGEWRYSQAKLTEFVQDEAEIVISKAPFRPNYVNRSGETKKTANLLSYRTNGVPTNEDATEEIRALFGADVMSYPKPSGLLKYLIRAVTGGDDIVMDFFAGSGTTAHAVWRQNAEDGDSRRFILVQLPETIDGSQTEGAAAFEFCRAEGLPPTIAEICKERLRRSGAAVRAGVPASEGDFGFRVLALDSSNIRAWEPDRDDLEGTLESHLEHLVPGRTEQDILFELLAKLGLKLTVDIEEREVGGRTVRSVGAGALIVCLSDSIGRDEAEGVAMGIVDWHRELAPAVDTCVVVRDGAFANDVAKTNFAAILVQHGIANVRSL